MVPFCNPGDARNFAIDAGVFVSLEDSFRRRGPGEIRRRNPQLDAPLPRPDTPVDETVSHTARLQYAVGRPWEIIRYTHPSGAITDIYTKLGDSGVYSSILVLLPSTVRVSLFWRLVRRLDGLTSSIPLRFNHRLDSALFGKPGSR